MNEILYVGLDDSNHAGDSSGEIIIATFSYQHEDSVVKPFKNSRRPSYAERWVKREGRDTRFTILTHEKVRHSSYNLPIVAPFLIFDFLSTAEEIPDHLKIYLDGRLEKKHKDLLREDFREDFPNVVIDNFIKKKKEMKGEYQNAQSAPELYMLQII